jgi:hypothetical protein
MGITQVHLCKPKLTDEPPELLELLATAHLKHDCKIDTNPAV